ncbi:MAG: transposase [Candidatus Bipolaricaulota bacterium]
MARMARVVVPGLPHHIVRRGVRGMDVFFSDDDRAEYVRQLADQGHRFGVEYIAWCLMTNHVHLVAIPRELTSLALGVGEAHRRYTRFVNFREGWRGYLFQGRFHSYPLDGTRLLCAVRYVLRNPVRAGLVANAWDYRWSSAGWFVGERAGDPLAVHCEMLGDIVDRRAFLLEEEDSLAELRKHARTGRPLGSESFIRELEQRTGRVLSPRKRGRKPQH